MFEDQYRPNWDQRDSDRTDREDRPHLGLKRRVGRSSSPYLFSRTPAAPVIADEPKASSQSSRTARSRRVIPRLLADSNYPRATSGPHAVAAYHSLSPRKSVAWGSEIPIPRRGLMIN